MMSIEYYKLGTRFCRHQYKNASVCIFVHESFDSITISTYNIWKKKDLEICAIKLNLPEVKIVIITISRSPIGNYNYFLRQLESILNQFYTKKNEFIICGDININYVDSHNRRQQLDTLLALYSLKSTVNFPMSIFNGSSTVIDNIFIDLHRNFTMHPPINEL